MEHAGWEGQIRLLPKHWQRLVKLNSDLKRGYKPSAGRNISQSVAGENVSAAPQAHRSSVPEVIAGFGPLFALQRPTLNTPI